MAQPNVTETEIRMAQVCLNCPISAAHAGQPGAAYWSAQHEAGSLCPSCQAYARVRGDRTSASRRAAL